MWLVATLLTKHTSMVNVWSQISHRLKQLPGPQKAKGPYLSWYSTVAGECVMSPKHWCLTVCSRRLLMGVWPCFFCCDVRLTEEFLISVLLELLSEMLEFDLDESWCFVAGIPNNSLEFFQQKVRLKSLLWQPDPFLDHSKLVWSLVGCHLWGHTESDTTEAT